jgi:hypothetical protein
MQHPLQIDEHDNEPCTINRVKRRLHGLIEVMPTRTKDVHNDQLLLETSVTILSALRRAIDWLQEGLRLWRVGGVKLRSARRVARSVSRMRMNEGEGTKNPQ